MSVDIGVSVIDANSLSSARPVAIKIRQTPTYLISYVIYQRKGMSLPMQFGHTALILIPSAANGLANDRTAPTTPCFVMPYIGAIANG